MNSTTPTPPAANGGADPAACVVGTCPVTDELVLVEVKEMVGAAGAATPLVPCETRRQYVNLPRDQAGAIKKEQGRAIHLKARVQWKSGKTTDLAGHNVRFYATAAGGNKAVAQLLPSLCAGFGGTATMNTSTNTGADGWTVSALFFVSRYGGDTFSAFATLAATDTGGLPAGSYTVWRKVKYEVDAMKRPSGTDYMDIAAGVQANFVTAHAGVFNEAVAVGSNSSPAHKRMMAYTDLDALHRATAGVTDDRYIHLMYVDTVLTGVIQQQVANFNVTVPTPTAAVPAPSVKLSLTAMDANFLPSETGWIVSAVWVNAAAGTNGTLTAANFGAPFEVGEYARAPTQGGNYDRWEFNVTFAGTGAVPGAAVVLSIRYNSRNYLSGVQIGQTTTVAMRFRELRNNNGNLGDTLANATLQTSIHESSHAFGLASIQRPDGSTNPDFITTGGGHCSHTTTCVMTPALHSHTAFCDFCTDNLRARKLDLINITPNTPMA